jgi:hypothetical protein
MQEIERDEDLGWLMKTLERILGVQRPLVVNHLRSLRKKHPEMTPEQMIRRLEKQYLAAVTGGGAAVGASAVAPGVGTVASVGLTMAETVGFLEASAFFAQSVAEVHGIAVEDEQRAKALVMGLMLGTGGKALVKRATEKALGRGAAGNAFWGQMITTALPSGAMGQVIDMMRRAFLKRMARNTGAGMLGRAMPFGIGAVIGGVGNNILGRDIVKAAREAFGPAPTQHHGFLSPVIKEVRPSLGQRIREAREIDREGLGGGLRRLRERRGADDGVVGDADLRDAAAPDDHGAPPMPQAPSDAPADEGRAG